MSNIVRYGSRSLSRNARRGGASTRLTVNPRGGAADEHEVEELTLYIENTAELMDSQSQGESIRRNLRRKAKHGIYDPALAVKGWSYLVDAGAKRYCREFDCDNQRWYEKFSVATRQEVARNLAESFEQELRDENIDVPMRRNRGSYARPDVVEGVAGVLEAGADLTETVGHPGEARRVRDEATELRGEARRGTSAATDYGSLAMNRRRRRGRSHRRNPPRLSGPPTRRDFEDLQQGMFIEPSEYYAEDWERGGGHSYGDFREARDGGWWLSNYASGSDYNGNLVEQSNYRVLEEEAERLIEAGEAPESFYVTLYGGHGTFGIAFKVDETPAEIFEMLAALEDYPLLSEELNSEMEIEAIDENWKGWAEYDYRKALEREFDGDADEIDDDVLWEHFEKYREKANVYWENETGDNMHVDIGRVVAAAQEPPAGFIYNEDEDDED